MSHAQQIEHNKTQHNTTKRSTTQHVNINFKAKKANLYFSHPFINYFELFSNSDSSMAVSVLWRATGTQTSS